MTPPALRLSGAARVGATPIFGPVEIEAEAGRWTCLLGPSGVGKSSVLRLFAGLGDNMAFVGELGASDGAPLAGRVALMAQRDLLMPWLDTRANLVLGARLRGERPDADRADHVLAQVGLAGLADRRPGALSGGQRQRAALARTLMEDRPVILLDEPFSALDARTRIRMQDLAADLLAGRTVLHVTHEAAEAARLGDRILVMTGDGVRDIAPPPTPSPRRPDAPETLEAQARLLGLLLETQ